MSGAIPDLDNLFRGAHHPVAFSNRNFRPLRFMKLWPDPNNHRVIEASFIWERYAPTSSFVHACGCRRSRQRQRDVYCGAYQLKAINVRELSNTEGLPEVAEAEIIHRIEDGEISHAGFRVLLSENVDEEDAEDVKTAIADRLWNSSRGPLKYECAQDRTLNPHPNTRLQRAPLGDFVDRRSAGAKAWYVIRYWVAYVMWKAGLMFRDR
jgi:hypothetical protein